jgi:hypothetical protein
MPTLAELEAYTRKLNNPGEVQKNSCPADRFHMYIDKLLRVFAGHGSRCFSSGQVMCMAQPIAHCQLRSQLIYVDVCVTGNMDCSS